MSEPRSPERVAHSWSDLAKAAAAERAADAEAEVRRELLCFDVAETPYAVPVEWVREIVRMRPITPIPRVARDVRGVISLRGEILQVVDLRLRLGLEPTQTGRRTRIIVVHAEDGRVAGLMVDAVREVLRVHEDAIGPPLHGEANGFVDALCARGEEFVSLVDLDRVLRIQDDA